MAERRTGPRGRTLKSGRIVFNDGRLAINCAVRNVSSGGALLEVTSTIGIPRTFTLTIDGEGTPHLCVDGRAAHRRGVRGCDGARRQCSRSLKRCSELHDVVLEAAGA